MEILQSRRGAGKTWGPIRTQIVHLEAVLSADNDKYRGCFGEVLAKGDAM